MFFAICLSVSAAFRDVLNALLFLPFADMVKGCLSLYLNKALFKKIQFWYVQHLQVGTGLNKIKIWGFKKLVCLVKEVVFHMSLFL